MSLFSDLLNEAADANAYPLENCLLKAKLLASRLRGRSFRRWVDAEVGGYPDVDSVPDYRVIKAHVYGNFIDPFRARCLRVKLDLFSWGEEVRSALERFYFVQNVAAIRQMLEADADDFWCELPATFIWQYRAEGEVRVSGMMLDEAHRVFGKASVQGVLLAVRARLLDFLIELRDKHPDVEEKDDAAAKVSEAEVSSIVQQTIYNNCQVVTVGGSVATGGSFTTAGSIAAGAGPGGN